ncbi:hypothetical protein OsI_26064 [Oryza sativa Indica Group]|uniref:Uncharacterized protein n=1 Tax=Oryza sativa subsp. indica TaxID=39946 RepID=B8B687_ORYSI|nr:hypothetical protein OsI_26064 [Oryza sativa Indica Group]
MEGGRRPDDGQDWRRVQCASPESRSTATDAPEASGLEVTTVKNLYGYENVHTDVVIFRNVQIDDLIACASMRGCIPGRLPLACEHLAVRPSGQAATGKTVIKQNKTNLWHGSRSTCGSHKGSPGQKARGSSYKEPGTAQELPHQLLHKSKAMDMFAQMLQVKWMWCYYWVMLLCDALGSSCCC